MFVLQDMANKTLNPGRFGPRFLTFFVQRLSQPTADAIQFAETESLRVLSALSGPT